MTELPAVTLLRHQAWTSDDGRPFSWDEFQIRDDAGPGQARRWCQILVWNEDLVSGFGGEAAPETWPALFRVLGPSGERRVVLTEVGALLLAAARLASRQTSSADAPGRGPPGDPRDLLRRPDVLDAVRSAAYYSETGPLSRHHEALVHLLRVADPTDETLGLLDRREHAGAAVASPGEGRVPDARLGKDDERALATMRRAVAGAAGASGLASALDAALSTARDGRNPLDDRHLWTLVRDVRCLGTLDRPERRALSALVAATRDHRRGRRLRASTAWRVRTREALAELAGHLATIDEGGESAVRRGLAWVDAAGDLPADLAWRREVSRLERLATRYGGEASPVATTLRELVEAVDVAAADQELLLLADEEEAARSRRQADVSRLVHPGPGAGA